MLLTELCTVWLSHSQWASRSASSQQFTCPFYSSCVGFFGKTSHHLGLSALLQLTFGSLWLLAFPKVKITIEREQICECDSYTVHKLSQWCLTANWLTPQDSNCSLMRSKVFSDWLPSYIKAIQPVLEIFNIDRYFPDRPRMVVIFEVFTFRKELYNDCSRYVYDLSVHRVHITISSDSLIPSMNTEVATTFLFYILCKKTP
jgi:hypothetical protein